MIHRLGGLHPAAVHFPIALIVMAAVAEVMFVRTGSESLAFVGRFMMSTGALFAALSVVLGFAATNGQSFGPELQTALDVHRVMGIVTAGLVVLTAGLAKSASLHGDSWRFALYRVLLILAVVSVGVTAHFGAVLTHGPNYSSWF